MHSPEIGTGDAADIPTVLNPDLLEAVAICRRPGQEATCSSADEVEAQIVQDKAPIWAHGYSGPGFGGEAGFLEYLAIPVEMDPCLGRWTGYTYLDIMAGSSKANGRAETGDSSTDDDDVQTHCASAR